MYIVPFYSIIASEMLQYQIFEAICNSTGYKGPLHECDLSTSTKAGEKYRLYRL